MKNPFKLEAPYALSMEVWDIFHQQMKENHPIKYFLSETLPLRFRVDIIMRIEEVFYFLRSHLVPSRRYHKLDLRQPKRGNYNQYRYGWLDASEQIFFANMNILVSFIEKEFGGYEEFLLRIEWLKEEKYSCEGEIDLAQIYWWWHNTRYFDHLILDHMLDSWYECEEGKQKEMLFKLHTEEEARLNELDTEMLCLLMKRRGIMWT